MTDIIASWCDLHIRIDSKWAQEGGLQLDQCHWEGTIRVPEGASASAILDIVFRLFNRVDDDDVQRLRYIGYNLPSLTAGDLVTFAGNTWRCASVGWEMLDA